MAVLVLLCLSIWIRIIVATFTPLYSETDKAYIHILDNSNFTQFLSQPDPHTSLPSATWIQFYNSWCGHCQKFSPIFKSLATDVKDWSSVIKLAVIDCSEDRNAEICRDYEIYMYPSMRYFPPSFKAMRDYSSTKPATFQRDSFGSGAEITGVRYDGELDTIGPLRKGMITALMSTYTNSSISIPGHWPTLQAINASSKSQLIQSLNAKSTIPILVVLESSDSQVASELILDFASQQDKVNIFRVSNASESLLKELATSVPSLLELTHTPDATFKVHCCTGETASKDKDVRSTFRSIVASKFLPELVSKSSSANNSDNNDQIRRPDVKANRQVEVVVANTPVYSVDLHNALRFSIYNQVAMHAKLNESQLNAFKKFIHVVAEYFPFEDDKAAGFIRLLKGWLSKKTHSISTDDLINEMSKFEEDYSLPEMKPYKGCAGSTARYRGFPCSLWTMFHTLTVAEYLKRNKSTIDAQSDDELSDHAVLPAMKDFIINFFGCTECAQHFAVESDKMEEKLVNPNSSVLWLWQTHNRVNKRLAGDLSEDPMHPKIQFPSAKMCPLCHKSPEHSTPPIFDEKEVFKYLLARYRSESIVKGPARVSMSPHANAVPVGSKLSIGSTNITSAYYSLLNRTDITLFILLYSSSVVLLVGLFLYFKLRGRRKKHSPLLNQRLEHV